LESAAYVLVFVSRGSLPWGRKPDAEVLRMKQETSPSDLTVGLHKEIQKLLVYARCLK
jgi:hypothetical protein